MESLVTLTTVRFDHEAQLLKSCLRSAGIVCFLRGEYAPSLTGRADWNNPLGGIEIKVAEPDLAAAREILHSAVVETDEVRPARLPWYGTITGGLRRVPLTLRIPLVVLGGPFFLFWAGMLFYAVFGSIWHGLAGLFIEP